MGRTNFRRRVANRKPVLRFARWPRISFHMKIGGGGHGVLPTARRVSHVLGYVGLEMFTEAAAELELIAKSDQARPDVRAARVELHMAARQWNLVITVAEPLARSHPDVVSAWIGWAYALRELNRVAEARVVLLEAENHHGATSAVLHYNLACYESLLGDLESARKRLRVACTMDKRLEVDSTTDPDLRALRSARRRKGKEN